VAVTGPTGTLGFGLLPLLEADDRVSRVVGVARRPFDPGELEESLRALADGRPGPALYLLRPCIVLGPHAVGAKSPLRPLAALGRRAQGPLGRLPIPVPVLVPDVPLQLVHEEDVARALLQCVVAAGPPGAYNIAGDGVLSVVDVAREVGLFAIPVPARPSRTAARTQLAWEPRFSGLEALRDALRR
jgi:nucleoside-diphosphate-sugar epimerase